jgi:hypothetical protein
MSPGLALVLLIAMLLALLPVWRLHHAGWRPGILFWAWVVYAASLVVVIRLPGPSRFLLPILVLAFVAPFVAGPERLARVLGRKARGARPVIDVTPKPNPGLPEPPRNVTPDDEDRGGIG